MAFSGPWPLTLHYRFVWPYSTFQMMSLWTKVWYNNVSLYLQLGRRKPYLWPIRYSDAKNLDNSSNETQKANNITTGNLYGGSGPSLKADNAVLGVEVLAVHLDQPQTKHLKYNGREQYSAPHKLFPNAGLIKKGRQNAAKRDHWTITLGCCPLSEVSSPWKP